MSIKAKISTVAVEIYGADGVLYSKQAQRMIDYLTEKRVREPSIMHGKDTILSVR
jgi:formyltetrahydrofolate synthetase